MRNVPIRHLHKSMSKPKHLTFMCEVCLLGSAVKTAKLSLILLEIKYNDYNVRQQDILT